MAKDLRNFVAQLKADIGGASAVTTLIGTRFHPIPVPEDSLEPRATYAINQVRPQTTLDGDDDEALIVEFQIDAWAGSFLAALAVSETIRGELRSWSVKTTPDAAEGNGAQLYEDDTRLHRFHWRYTAFFQTTE